MEIELSGLIFEVVTFRTRKIKKTHSEKTSYISGKWNFLAPSLKNLCFRMKLARPEDQKFLIFLFKHKCKRKEVFYTFPYKEAKFSKLKCCLVFITKHFFSFNIFFYTQSVYFFHLLREFSNIHDHIIAFFLFLRKILMSFTNFFCSLSLFS